MSRDAAADEHRVHAVAQALCAAVNTGDVPSILACWALDGVLQPPHHPAVYGHEAIAEYFRRVFAVCRLAFTFTRSVVTVHDSVALENLSYTAIATTLTGSGRTEDVGKGLHVYGRQPLCCERAARALFHPAQLNRERSGDNRAF